MNKTEINYWNNIYKTKNIPKEPSNFCKFITEYKLFKNNKLKLLDCGCGNGRDSYYFSKYFNVTGIDSSFKPNNINNCIFKQNDFCSYDKSNYDLIYSRFTFHSITDEQQELFLSSIKKNSFLCIETRSNKSKDIKKVFGDEHYRNYTDYNNLLKKLKLLNFDIIYSEENSGFSIYKNEDPICIRIICKKI
jgi:tellurite methyltransferase